MTPRAEVTLPREIETERLADGVRYRLPKRQLGKARWAGLILLLIGLVGCGFGVSFISGPLESMADETGPARWFLLVFVLAGCIPVIAGLGFIGMGIATMANRAHAEVEMRDGKLIAVERVGIFRWRRRRPADRIEQIVLDKTLSGVVKADWAKNISTLVAKGKGIVSMPIAPGYPASLLRPLAEVLAERIEAKVIEQDFLARKPDEVPVDKVPIPQPAKSTIDMSVTDDGTVSFTARPLGFWRGCRFLAIFSIGWLTFSALMSGAAIVDAIQEGTGEAMAGAAFTLLFVAIGMGLVVAAMYIGRRVVIIDVVGDTLLITTGGMFGTKLKEFRLDELKSIGMGSSNVKVNGRPLEQLQIRPRDGKTLGLLTYRKDDELDWLSQQLRLATGVA